MAPATFPCYVMRMPTLTEDLENLHYEIATESRLVRTGQKDTLNTAEILKRHEHLASPSKIKELLAAALIEKKRENKEKLNRQYFAVLGIYLSRMLAEKRDAFETFLSGAKVHAGGQEIPYYQVLPLLAREPDFDRREALGLSLKSVQQKANPLMISMIGGRMKILREELGYKNYAEYCRDKKEMTYTKFSGALEDTLHRTTTVYLKAAIPWIEQKLKRKFKEIRRWHVPYLFHFDSFNPLFPREKLIPLAALTFRAMGLDWDQYPNIKLDLEERPKKNPRACVITAKIPEEVHLILKPVGGLTDFETFFHESGHALHYGSAAPDLAYEFRHLSRSNALTETYAFLLQNLTMDEEWLTEIAGVEKSQAGEIRKSRILYDLFMFRRYVGKFTAELLYYQKEDWQNASFYESSLRSATQFIYEPEQYLLDQDSEFYSADYLAAWTVEAQLQEFMKERFSKRWFANPKAGEFLLDLWREGDKISVFDLAKKIDGNVDSTAALERRFTEI